MNKDARLDFPKSVRVSSNFENESVFNIKNLIRQNRVCHHKFIPELESTRAKKLLKGLYTPNEPDREEEVFLPVTEYIVNSGNYKD